MGKINTIMGVALCALIFTACSSKDSVKVASLQKKDKNLSCSEVLLEINEAEFYRNTAERNKKPGVKTLLMPLGYISTYMDADEAAGAADARIDYLNRIYDIMQCDEQETHMRQVRQQMQVPSQVMMQAPMPGVQMMAVPMAHPMSHPQAQRMSIQPMSGSHVMTMHQPVQDNWYW